MLLPEHLCLTRGLPTLAVYYAVVTYCPQGMYIWYMYMCTCSCSTNLFIFLLTVVPQTTSPPPTTSTTTQEVTTPPQCQNGKIYSSCGSPCPLSCDSPHSNNCTFECTAGCFCPHGMVEYDDICVHPTTCPGVCVLNCYEI